MIGLMKWRTLAPVWAADDTAAAGADAAAGAGTEGAGSEGDGPAEGEAAPKGAAAKPESLLDYKPHIPGDDPPADGWKPPEGLPEHLIGETPAETVERLAKAYRGARQELSKRGGKGMEGAVPDSPDGYQIEPTGEDDRIAAELNSEGSRPILDEFRKAAHKHGIPAEAFAALMRDGMAGLAEQGLDLGLSAEEATKVSHEREAAALVEMVGAKGAATMLSTVSGVIEKMQAAGVIADEADAQEARVMFGTARAVKVFHNILTHYLGEAPIPPAHAGAMNEAEWRAAMMEAQGMKDGPAKQDRLAQLSRAGEQVFGGAATGQVRSRVAI